MDKTATLSPCGSYRYRLTRRWASDGQPLRIIMLNPSTADAELDDPTIRRCLGFANREGFTGIEVANLFAVRTPSPEAMKCAYDPVGPENDQHLFDLLEAARDAGEPVLCAWGAHGSHQGRSELILRMARELGTRLVALGLTGAGQPRHPLYLAGDAPFMDFGA